MTRPEDGSWLSASDYPDIKMQKNPELCKKRQRNGIGMKFRSISFNTRPDLWRFPALWSRLCGTHSLGSGKSVSKSPRLSKSSKQNVSYGGNGGVNCNCAFSRVQWHLKGLKLILLYAFFHTFNTLAPLCIQVGSIRALLRS